MPESLEQFIRRALAEAQQAGRSFNELARLTGVSQPQLSRFANGERTLTLPAASKVCEALGLRLVKDTAGGRKAKT